MFKYTVVTALALSTSLASTARLVTRQDSSGPNVGDATFFAPGLGACGITNSAQDFIVAVSAQFFNSFGPESNGNPVCGRLITATASGGQTVTVTVEDKCPGCAEFDLDLSPAAFDVLADPSVGRIHGVTWELL